MEILSVIGAFARHVVSQAGGVCERRAVVDALWERMEAASIGPDQVDRLVEAVTHEPGSALLALPADRIVDVALVSSGLVLTHRLSADEVVGARLDLAADLGALDLLAGVDGGLHAPDGWPLHLHEVRARTGREGGMRRSGRLEGPPGWLERFEAGQLVAVRPAGGFLSIEAVADDELSEAPSGFAEDLAAAVDLLNEGDGLPLPSGELQLLVAVDHSQWLTVPRRPFGELAQAAGFEVDGDLVARPGAWERYEQVGELIGTIARHDLDDRERKALLDAVKAFEAWRDDAGAAPPRALAERLARLWPVAEPLAEELRRRGAGPGDLSAFCTALGGAIGAWLGVRAAGLVGDTEEAERGLATALPAHPGFGPLLAEKAWYEGDRGRAREAVNLLQQVRGHHDPELAGLRRWAAASTPSAGRNDPCPCGSGRKYKQCHLGRPTLAEGDRVSWLVDKALRYVAEAAPPEDLDELVRTGGHDPTVQVLATELLTFDAGWLDRFLAARGRLLPDVEREWAERWSTGHVGSLFRLCSVDGDGRAVLEDLRTGERRTVESADDLDDVPVDRLVWARLVPVEDRWWSTGVARLLTLADRARVLPALAPGTPVTDRLRALVPEPRRTRIRNTSGDPTVLCTTTCKVGDPAGLAGRLDEALRRDGEEQVWRSTADTPNMSDAVTATFTLDGAELRVETNSLRRRDEALAMLAGLGPAVEVLDDTRVPLARAQALHEEEELLEGLLDEFDGDEDEDEDGFDDEDLDDEDLDEDDEDDEDLDDHDLDAALAELMEAYQQRWVDEPVPALDGRTPRQAAADPAARADLLTLLAEMDGGAGVFDVDRLRADLGLDGP